MDPPDGVDRRSSMCITEPTNGVRKACPRFSNVCAGDDDDHEVFVCRSRRRINRSSTSAIFADPADLTCARKSSSSDSERLVRPRSALTDSTISGSPRMASELVSRCSTGRSAIRSSGEHADVSMIIGTRGPSVSKCSHGNDSGSAMSTPSALSTAETTNGPGVRSDSPSPGYRPEYRSKPSELTRWCCPMKTAVV